MNEASDLDAPSLRHRLRDSWKRVVWGLALAFVMTAGWDLLFGYSLYGMRQARLLRAAAKGDVEGVLKRLDWFEEPAHAANVALLQAVGAGHREVVDAVLPRTNREGRTRALRKAVLAHRSELIGPLTAAVADVNAPLEEGGTLLMIAAAYGDRESVAALLAAGADVRMRDVDGKTARDLAAAVKEREIVGMLDAALFRAKTGRSPRTTQVAPSPSARLMTQGEGIR